jgi:endonuclease/exonuclease/phosphatase (EEP) superfamily protein YafD
MTASLIRRLLGRLVLAALATIAIVEWVLALLRPEGGSLGIVQIVAPHLALLGLVLIPISLLRPRPVGLVAAIALLAITGLRFSGDWVSIPVSPPSADLLRLHLVTWNLEVFSRPGTETAAVLRTVDADVIALQELQPEAATAIEADPILRERFPYRVLVPSQDVVGLGLLSRFPIGGATYATDPAIQEATLDVGGGQRLAIVHAHPFHAEIASLGDTRLPLGIDVGRRNADLVEIRRRVDARLAAGLPVLLVGDLNTADSEPAFDRLVAGFRDVHAEVGEGTGWTWRPIRLEFLGLGVLRIDHVIVSRAIVPVSIRETCPTTGDHCLVRSELGIAPGG